MPITVRCLNCNTRVPKQQARQGRCPTCHRQHERTRRASGSARYPAAHKHLRDQLIPGGTCAHQGADCKGPLQLDHIIPRSAGGPHTPTNTQVLCAYHNAAKGNRPN